MAYRLKLNHYEKNIQEAIDLVSQYYSKSHVARMTLIEIQYEFGRLYAAGHRVNPIDSAFRKFVGLGCEEMAYDTRCMLDGAECHVVYYFYSADDVLLYVGRTNNFKTRWAQHLTSQKEMRSVSKVVLNVFENKAETMFFEAQKIVTMSPVWNIAGTGAVASKQYIKPLDIVTFKRV